MKIRERMGDRMERYYLLIIACNVLANASRQIQFCILKKALKLEKKSNLCLFLKFSF